jgi:DNA-binding GntR family transcriptional regulator
VAHEVAITRSVLSDQVKGRLLQAILDGRYPPGARIVETRVAREFGTSQAPVREALRDLEALGVVEIAPFRGARVRHPSRDELLEAYIVRAELEALGVRLAVPRLTGDDLDQLGAYLADMRRAAAAGDAVGEASADAAFHGYLIERAGNSTLKRVWGMLEPYSRTYITIAVPGSDRHLIAERHAPVLDALRARDADEADSAIRHHFADASAMLADLWSDGADPVGEPPPKSQPRAARADPTRAATARATERTR